MHSLLEGIKQIGRAKKIAIISHLNCDADAICSSMALKMLINKRYANSKNKKKIDIFTDTESLSQDLLPIVSHLTFNKQRYKKYDLAICLDCPTASRMGKFQEVFNNSKSTLKIDHHITGEDFALNNVVKNVSSTCEIIYNEFILKRKWKLSSEVYRLLYCGIITDTNDLTQNTFNSTHIVIADLLENDLKYGLSLETLKNHFFKSSSKQQMQLLQKALQSLTFVENDRIASMKIIKQDLTETGCKQEDTMGIVDYALKMKGVEIGVIFIKQEDNSYYVSLRSKEQINVGEIAKNMGGGGHLNVAAFQSSLPLTDIKQQLFSHCKQALGPLLEQDPTNDLFDEEV